MCIDGSVIAASNCCLAVPYRPLLNRVLVHKSTADENNAASMPGCGVMTLK